MINLFKRPQYFEAPLIFLLSFAYYLYFQRIHPLFSDEFNIFVQAERILNGQVPYRDFFQFTTPGALYLMALWFKIFGRSIESIRIISALQGTLIVLLTWVLLKKVVKSNAIRIAGLLLTLNFSNTLWPIISHHWLSTIFAMYAVLIMADFVQRGSYLKVFSAGFLSAICFLFLQNKGIFLITSFFVFLFLSHGYFKRTPDVIWRVATVFFSGAVLPVFLFLVYFYFSHALDEFFYNTVIWVSGPYRKFNSYPNYYFMGNYAIFTVFTQNRFPWNFIRIRDWALIGYLPVFTLLFAVLFLFRNIKNKMQAGTESMDVFLLYAITGFFMFLSVLYRSDTVHLTFIFPFIIILLCYMVEKWMESRKGRGIMGSTLPVSVLALLLVAGFYGIAARIRDAGKFKTALDTSIGRFYMLNEESAGAYRAILEFIKKNIPQKEIFVYNWASFIYFLTEKENPTRYDGILPGYNTERQFEETVKELQEKHIQYIVHDSLESVLASDPLAASYPNADVNLDNVLNRFIKNNYSTVFQSGDAPLSSLRILRLDGR
ncbi:MAG TPA: glycosyltransferase family 39 protein [bacterium]